MIIKLFPLFIFLFMPLILVMMNFIVSMKFYISRISLSSFECGFDPFNSSRIPFSLHFFLLSIIFLVFDLEIILIFPFPLMMNLNSNFSIFSMFILMIILFWGLFHEWNEGSLEWM